MGATDVYMTVDGKKNEAQVKQAFAEKQSDDAHEYGHGGYSGSFAEFNGISFTRMEFATVDEAGDWIEKNSQKWGPALAVKYKAIKKTKRIENYELKMRGWSNELWASQNPRTKKALEKRIVSAREKIKEIQKTLAGKSKKTMWLIGGWVSE